MKAPRITESAARLADHARDAGWTHEDDLAAVLEREVAARNASGARLRIRAAQMPAVKTIEDFDFDQQPTARTPIHALASGAYLTEHRNRRNRPVFERRRHQLDKSSFALDSGLAREGPASPTTAGLTRCWDLANVGRRRPMPSWRLS